MTQFAPWNAWVSREFGREAAMLFCGSCSQRVTLAQSFHCIALAAGTLRGILKQAGVTLEEFLAAL
jgi:hypothetical protein